MANYFFDSSSLMKRYAKEQGKNLVLNIFRRKSNHRINIAEITYVEIISALSRRHRGKTISTANFQRSLTRFRRAFQTKFYVTPISLQLIEAAASLAEKHFLRGYDAVQLACALEIEKTRKSIRASSIIFVSADNALNQAAQAEGLAVDNPNNYP